MFFFWLAVLGFRGVLFSYKLGIVFFSFTFNLLTIPKFNYEKRPDDGKNVKKGKPSSGEVHPGNPRHQQ